MAIRIEMPKLSDTMESGTLVKWYKQEGDTVAIGDIIADVDTDKATMEIEAFEEGVLLKIVAQENQEVELGDMIAIIGEVGEDISTLMNMVPEVEKTTGSDNTKVEREDSHQKEVLQNIPNEEGRIKASPLAKSIAEEKHLDLYTITGSGPDAKYRS
jgi:pyruvate dehydrogenase E2 component (dihydrolipoamide acetyltransferase)